MAKLKKRIFPVWISSKQVRFRVAYDPSSPLSGPLQAALYGTRVYRRKKA